MFRRRHHDPAQGFASIIKTTFTTFKVWVWIPQKKSSGRKDEEEAPCIFNCSSGLRCVGDKKKPAACSGGFEFFRRDDTSAKGTSSRPSHLCAVRLFTLPY